MLSRFHQKREVWGVTILLVLGFVHLEPFSHPSLLLCLLSLFPTLLSLFSLFSSFCFLLFFSFFSCYLWCWFQCETIPFGTNNVGEFKGCLLGLKSARGLDSHIQIVGDCMILTKAAPKNCNISNHKLNLLLIEIRAIAARFEDAKFIHVFHELNKHVNTIATAASWSVMDGIAAVNDPK